ncbi:hypothetical protein [Dactylosporangium fulvum]|uniref:MoeX5 n=1 Tax=Dactylosporangium fulvum TaxID=53359 RepID=A0ABY5VWW3_9ACTN|nr:hypothetical protein [Dactylosporangium fulvum]UWP81331.1 hypothetical protein Dfulv_40445 [Dactylosporangium fulvum]
MRKMFTVAEMALREIGRRRGVLAILLLLPLAFYLTRRSDHIGQSIRFVFLGLSWAMSTAALFAASAARSMEPRLRLGGYRGWQLVLGRLGALWGLGAVISVPYFLLVRFDQRDVRHTSIALVMALLVLIAPLFGVLLAAVLPRELEGTLVLLLVVGLQMMMDPSGDASKLLPFWFSREIGTYAIDLTDSGFLFRGLVHAAVTLTVLVVALGIASGIRLRRRRHFRFAAAGSR